MDSALIAALIAAFASLFVGLINVFISIHKNKQDIHSTISEYIGGIDEICHTEFTGEHSPSHIDIEGPLLMRGLLFSYIRYFRTPKMRPLRVKQRHS